MKEKSMVELGILAQAGDEDAMGEIIARKFSYIYKKCHGDEDEMQFVLEHMINAIKNYKFF